VVCLKYRSNESKLTHHLVQVIGLIIGYGKCYAV
jgi:hypothetical protein